MLAHALQRAGARGIVLRRLSEQHGWSLRALYRDIALLEAAGYPVVHENQRYRLLEGWHGTSPLGIDADELTALFLARVLAMGWKATSLGKGLDRLWEKLTTTGGAQPTLLPTKEPPWLAVRAPLGIDYRAHAETIGALEQAIRGRTVLRCVYSARGRGDTTTREIEPGEVYWDPGLETLYALAYCRLRKDVRIFAVHRIRQITALGSTFELRPGISSRTALRSAFRIWRGGTVRRVRVRFESGAAEYVRERRWHEQQRIEEHAGGALVLELEIAGFEEVERWLLGFGAEALVLEPAELVERIVKIHEACLKAVRRGPVRAEGPPKKKTPKPGALAR